MGKLVLRLPNGGTREYALERERTTIGRRPDNDICLPFPAVSGEHAAVVTILDDSFLEDLNSTNGTLVNGRTITKHFLRDHDEIDIGRQTLVYHSGDFAGLVAETASEEAAADRSEGTPAHAMPAARRDPSAREGTLPLQSLEPPQPQSRAVDTIEWFAPHGAADAGDTADDHRASADAPTLEVLDGPNAGTQRVVGRDDFVLGRLGVSVAAVRRTPDGFRLVHVEGDVRPRINGAALPHEGSLLALGDEIEVAGTRILYRPAI